MGSSLSKYILPDYLYNMSHSPFPTTPKDPSRVGDVYLTTYTESSDSPEPTTAGLRAHYTVVIDVAGESTPEVPMGLELHLGVQRGTPRTLQNHELKFCVERLEDRRSKYQSHQLLGRIENIYHPGNPLQWAYGLTAVVQDVWLQEFSQSRGTNCNCHQFAKFLTQKLGLVWPNNIYVAGDGNLDEPIIVDIIIATASASR